MTKFKTWLSLLLALCLSLSLSVPAFAAEGGEEAADEPMFSDIADHWAKDVILKYVDMGVINGCGNGTFQPDRVVTRAELSKILTLAFDLTPGEISYEDMQDPTVWYYPYAACADRYLPRYCPVGHVANPSLFWPYFVNFQNYNVFLPGAQVSRVHAAEALVEIALRQAGVVTEKGWRQYGAVYGGRQELIPGATDYENRRYDWASVDMVQAMFPDDDQLASTVTSPRGDANPSNQQRVYDYVWLAVQMGIMQGNDEGLFLPYNGITRAELLTIIDRVLTADPSSLVENLQIEGTQDPVTELAYMDLESAPAEIRADILAAREKIIFGDQAWTVNGAVSIFGRDGTIQELPEFSELYPDWELPGAAATSSVPASAMPMGTYSGEINYEEQVNFQLASSWANSKDFTQFVGNGDYVYVYAKSMPRNANFNIGFSNGAGVNIGWCPNLDKETGARIDSDSNKTYNVRGSAANEASVSVYRMVITSDEKDAMSWLDPMYP